MKNKIYSYFTIGIDQPLQKMFNLPSQSKILFIFDQKDNQIKDSMNSFCKLFSITSYLYKNIDCLANKDVLTSTMNKRKCKIAINCFSDSKKNQTYYLSFIRLTNDNIEFLRYKICSSKGFVSTGPIVGSRNIMFFKNIDQNTRSLFTDVFYNPSSHIDPRSLLNIIYIEKKEFLEATTEEKSSSHNKSDQKEQICTVTGDMTPKKQTSDLFHKEVIHKRHIISLLSSKNASEIGPTFILDFLDSHLLSYAEKPVVKKIKNVKTSEQRKSGRIYVPQQSLSGFKLKKGIFKNTKA